MVTEQPVVTISPLRSGIAASQLPLADRVLFAAQVVIVGAADVTVTLKLQLPPCELLQVTEVVPTGKVEPDAGVQETVPQFPLVVGSA